jgi:hypothetical protein
MKKALLLAIAGATAFLFGLLSVRLAPAQPPERFDLRVRQDFFAGFSGDREALARGMKACEEDLAKNPNNPEALVWHGGGLIFGAGQAFQSGDQQTGMGMWQRGLAEMQSGVSLKDDPSTRIPRGAVLLNASRYAPPEMGKPLLADGVADFERTLEFQKSYFDTLGVHPRGELLFGIAEGYSRLGDQQKAQSYFQRIKTDLPGTAYAKRADLWLATKSLPMEQTGCVGCHVAK